MSTQTLRKYSTGVERCQDGPLAIKGLVSRSGKGRAAPSGDGVTFPGSSDNVAQLVTAVEE